MRSIFDKTTRDEVITRIKLLNENSQAQWGKMNIYQMLKHCTLCEEMCQGKKKYKRAFIGRLFGKIGLKQMLKNESPIKANSPTAPGFKVKEISRNVPTEKTKWISLMEEYADYPDEILVHWFFGKMSREQVGQFVYKHTDHHLRQFNV